MEEGDADDDIDDHATDLDNQIFIDSIHDGSNNTHSNVDVCADEDIHNNSDANSSTLDFVYNFPVVHPSFYPSSEEIKSFNLDAGVPTGFRFQMELSNICTRQYGACVGGTKNNTINLIVRQYVYLNVMFWYFFYIQ
jgi:hypothetical protein